MNAEIRARLDSQRQAAGAWSDRGHLVREHAPTGTACRIAYARCGAETIEDDIRQEIQRAESGGYNLEWKVYDYDGPSGLDERLVAAGFVRGEAESVLALRMTDEVLARFGVPACEIRRAHDAAGLDDVAEIAREIGRRDVEDEKRRLALALEKRPDSLSIHVAYLDGEPVASGRVHFTGTADAAELAGGRTKTTHRRRGLFRAIVGARLKEALARQRAHVFVDALPSSEPILTKLGFSFVCRTRPFVYQPRADDERLP